MKLFMKRGISILLSLTLVLAIVGMPEGVLAADGIVQVSVTGTYGQTEARSMLSMINDFRTGSDAWYWNSDNSTKTTCTDLDKLVYDYELEQAAMQRAMEIALSFSHTRPNGEDCFTAYSFSAAGENIAAGYENAEAVFEAWKETDEDYDGQGHRRNMLNDSVTAIGIGHVKVNGYHYWVQEFRSPTGSTAKTEANDKKTKVSIDVQESQITSATIQSSVEECRLKLGTSTELPELSVSMKTEETWPDKEVPVETQIQWSSGDPSCAAIEEGRLVGKKEGKTTITASALGESLSFPVIVKDKTALETMKLSEDQYVYDGTAKCPDVVVKAEGKTLKKGTDYTVTYSNNIDVGTAMASVTGTGDYTGTLAKEYSIGKASQSIDYTSSYTKTYGSAAFSLKAKVKKGDGTLSYTSSDPAVVSVSDSGKVTLKGTGSCTVTIKAAATKNYKSKTVKVTIKVKPKQAKLKSLKTVKGKKLKVTWNRDQKASGYQIQYSVKKNFGSAKLVTVTKNSTVSKTLTKLTKGKKYYVRVRSYKNTKVNEKATKLYGSWSTAKRSGAIK